MTAPTRPTLLLDRIKVGKRFRKNLGSIDDLTDSIRELGLLHPIVVDADGNLIAGERRLAAFRLLGLRDIPATIVELDAEKTLRAQDDENAIRKDFTPTEAVGIRDARLERETGKAKERKESSLKQNAPSAKVSPTDKGRAKDKAAAGTGYSSKTLDKAAAVMEAAAADPDLEPVVEEMDETGKVDPAYRKTQAAKEFQRSPERVFSGMLKEMEGALNYGLDKIDFSVIVPTTTQKKQLAHILHALGKVRRTVEQNAVTAKAFGTGPDDRKVINADPVIDIVPAVTGAESTTTPTPTTIN